MTVLQELYAGVRCSEAAIDLDGLSRPDAIRPLVEITFDTVSTTRVRADDQ